MRKKLSLVLAALLILTISLPSVAFAATDYSTIRVRLASMGSPTSVTFVVKGAYRIAEAPNVDLFPGVTYTMKASGTTQVLSYNNGLQTVSVNLPATATFVQYENGSSSNYLYVNNPGYGWCYYDGDMAFIRPSGTSTLQLVNKVFLETYLYGVIAYEMSNSWPLEALKVQAVCARTYAIKFMQANPNATYQIGDTATNQVYKGFPLNADGTPQQRVIDAVNGTRGKVITLGDPAQMTLADGVFSASNGGQIRTASMHWGSANTYHVFKDDPYDLRNSASPTFKYIFPVKNDSATLNLLSSSDRSKVDAMSALLKEKLVPALKSQKGITCTADDITITGIKSATPTSMRSGVPANGHEFTQVAVTVSVSVQGGSATPPSEQQGRVTTDGGPLNVRSQPSMSGSILKTIPNGTTVTILDLNAAAGWYKISYSGTTGYVSSDYITLITSAAAKIALAATATPTAKATATATPSAEPTATATAAASPTATAEVTPTVTPAATQSATPTASPEATATEAGAGGGGSPAATFTGDIAVTLQYVSKASDGDYDVFGELKTRFASFNSLVNTTNLWNLYAEKSSDGKFLYVVARGYGHGVGMSQRGAQQMANEGKNYEQILDFYFNIGTTSAGIATISLTEKALKTIPGKGASAQFGTVTASTLNIRTAANTGATSIATLTKDTKVEVLDVTGDWYKVLVASKGLVGYACYRSSGTVYIKLISATPTPTPTPKPTVTPTPTPKPSATTGKVTASLLNIRKTPSTSAAVVGQAPKGATVTITGAKTSTGWYPIKYGSVTGYVMSTYISIVTATPTPTPPPAGTTGKVTASSLNIRKSGSTSAAIVGSAPKGATVSILSAKSSTGWYMIKYGSITGYVLGQYLTISAPTASPKPTPTPTPTPSPSGTTAKVTASLLNIRKSGSTSSAIVGQVAKGATVTITGAKTSSGWYPIKYGSITGYVLGTYLSITSPTSTATTAPTPTPTPSSTTAKVNASSLNIRKSASTSAAIVGKAPRDATVTVTGAKTSTGWYPIKYGSVTGYVLGTYLTFGSSTPTTAKVNASSLNIRKSASTSAAIVGKAPRDATVTITGAKTSTGWYPIKYGSVAGYVLGTYLTIGSSTPSPSYISLAAVAGKANVSDSLNLRKSASTSSTSLAKIPRNASMTVLQVESNASWLKVSYQGKTGYVMARYVTVGSSTAYRAGTVTTGPLNVRTGAGSSKSVKGLLKAGNTVVITATVQADSLTWYKIIAGSGDAYIDSRYCRKATT